MYTEVQPAQNFAPRTIGRIILAIIVTACVAPQVFNFLSKKARNPITEDQPAVYNMVMDSRPIVQQDHHHRSQQPCNYVQESEFHFPYAAPSCAWLSSTSSASYECVDATTVTKTEYDATGCSRGSGTKGAVTTIVNGQNGAIVDCSNAQTCFATSAIVSNTQCPVQQRPALADVTSKEDYVLGVCFGVFFQPKNTRYGCEDNELVTDRYEGAGCTSVFYRAEAPSCAAIAGSNSNSAQLYECSRHAPEPAEFPEPNVERESCGGSKDPSMTFQLNQCYATSFSSPVLHRCVKRQGKTVHVETLFSGNDCAGTVVTEISIPTEVCVNGIEEECEGRFSGSGVSAIPNSDAIVGTLYNSATCSGTGISFRLKRNVEFNVGFKKLKFLCSAGGVEEQENGQTVRTRAFGACNTVSGNLGKRANGGALGTHVKFDQCS